MDLWERKFVDLVAPAYIKFNGEEGEMRFIGVKAWIDIRYSERDGLPLAEFSWQGVDERDDRSGRGWVMLDRDDKLSGHFYFHMGDASGFVCKRWPAA